jgi:hypothetical protein
MLPGGWVGLVCQLQKRGRQQQLEAAKRQPMHILPRVQGPVAATLQGALYKVVQQQAVQQGPVRPRGVLLYRVGQQGLQQGPVANLAHLQPAPVGWEVLLGHFKTL